jgi:hypothetical protein
MVGRRKLDAYPTEARVTEVLRHHVILSGNVLEVCAGAGSMARVLLSEGTTAVFANDINPVYETDYVSDAADAAAEVWRRQWDWVVTNPPFSQAHEILPLAWENCRVGVAFLLRLTYLEPAGNRADWLQEHSRFMSHLIIFGQPRPSFTNNGKTDSVTTAWMVWQKRHQDGCLVEFAPKWKS